MKAAMERAAARGKVAVAGRDLGGEFPVHDAESNQGGLLQVRIDGVALLFADRQVVNHRSSANGWIPLFALVELKYLVHGYLTVV